MERQLLIPVWYSKGLALGLCWFFLTLPDPLEGHPSCLSSSWLCAPYGLVGLPSLVSALLSATGSHTPPSLPLLDLRFQLLSLSSWSSYFGETRFLSHDPLLKTQDFSFWPAALGESIQPTLWIWGTSWGLFLVISLRVHLFVHLSVHLSLYSFVFPPIHHPLIRSSVYLSVHPCIQSSSQQVFFVTYSVSGTVPGTRAAKEDEAFLHVKR